MKIQRWWLKPLILSSIFVGVTLLLMQQLGIWEYYLDPYEQEYVLALFTQHLWMVTASMLLAFGIGLGLGILFSRKRFRAYSPYMMYVVSLGQTVPSLAVLALMIGVTGVGEQSAILALFIVSVLPIARNTLYGLLGIDPAIVNAAHGLGMPAWQILFKIELPNTLELILTGLRIALVINIGTATLGYLIGAGGLGDLVFTGIQLLDTQKLLAGVFPIMLMAILGDTSIGLLSRWLIPRGIR